mmetsp:Transcript_3739/g.8331  ORF Transcript_3739/g.8331 Transcript_3739/m.8331 type:complete len:283 (-) Transcript_3739:94-942(-)
MVTNASVAGSDMDTHDGLGVITSETQVVDAGRFFATRRRVTSVSVMIPARPPLLSVMIAASPLLLASICATERTVSLEADIIGALGRSLDTGISFLRVLLDDLTDRLTLPLWLCTDAVSVMSSHSIALANIVFQPSAPPDAYTQSITSTIPTTLPLASQTGRVKNLLSCIIWSASNTVVSGDTDSGFGVMTVDTAVKSKGSSFAMARVIISLNPKIPTSWPLSTTNAALRASAIILPVSWIVVDGETMVDGLPAKMARSVGEDWPLKALDSKGPSNCCKAAA